MPEPTLGTANILHQHSAYQDLKRDYSPETASELTAKSLTRHGVDTTPGEVEAWDKINCAALNGKVDIPAERFVAEAKSNGIADALIASAHQASSNVAMQQFDADEPEDDETAASSDDELLTIDEMYGYEDPDDNAEAALDDVLKAQERD